MEIIVKSVGTGKTTELIKRSAENWYHIVCLNVNHAIRIGNHAQDMGLDIPFPITWDEFVLRQYSGLNLKGFLFDDLDMMLHKTAGVPIIAATINSRKKNSTDKD